MGQNNKNNNVGKHALLGVGSLFSHFKHGIGATSAVSLTIHKMSLLCSGSLVFALPSTPTLQTWSPVCSFFNTILQFADNIYVYIYIAYIGPRSYIFATEL